MSKSKNDDVLVRLGPSCYVAHPVTGQMHGTRTYLGHTVCGRCGSKINLRFEGATCWLPLSLAKSYEGQTGPEGQPFCKMITRQGDVIMKSENENVEIEIMGKET